MSRKKAAIKREVLKDPKYGDLVITKFINAIMEDGERGTAEAIVYGALDSIKQKTGEEPLAYFQKALNNIKPPIEVKSRRVGGAN